MPDIELGQNYTIEEDSNGDLVITDGDGTPVMTHDDSADTWTLADSTGVNDLTDATSGATVYDTATGSVTADVDNESVSTEEALATGETFIRARRGSDTTSTTAGTFVNVFDSEAEDNRGEFSAGQFTPDKNGVYELNALVLVAGNTVAGDELRYRVQNVDEGSNVISDVFIESPAGPCRIPVVVPAIELTGGDTYELQLKNEDSSFTIGQSGTIGTWRWSVVQ